MACRVLELDDEVAAAGGPDKDGVTCGSDRRMAAWYKAMLVAKKAKGEIPKNMALRKQRFEVVLDIGKRLKGIIASIKDRLASEAVAVGQTEAEGLVTGLAGEKKGVPKGEVPDEYQSVDEHIAGAWGVICDTKRVSVSMLQRRLKIGYGKAVRVVERMEVLGWIRRGASGGPTDWEIVEDAAHAKKGGEK
jgi:hypothetical protein